MEIRLGLSEDFQINSNKRIERLKMIPEEEYQQYRIAALEIAGLNANKRLLRMVKLNQSEFSSYYLSGYNILTHKARTKIGIETHDSDEIFLNFNRLLLNYLSSTRTFLDHSETMLNRKFGPDSIRFKEYKKIVSSIYDDNFSYRFFYKLRNYSQHCGLPLEFFTMAFSFPELDKLNIKMEIKFDRDKLLENFSEWGVVKSDLQKMTKNFEVEPLLTSVTNLLSSISETIDNLNKENIIRSAEFINKMTEGVRQNNKQMCFFKHISNQNLHGRKNYEMEIIPISTVDFALSYLKT